MPIKVCETILQQKYTFIVKKIIVFPKGRISPMTLLQFLGCQDGGWRALCTEVLCPISRAHGCRFIFPFFWLWWQNLLNIYGRKSQVPKRDVKEKILTSILINNAIIINFWPRWRSRQIHFASSHKRRTTTNLKTKDNQNCQKTELYGSQTTKELKKKHSSRLVGGVDMGSWGRGGKLAAG